MLTSHFQRFLSEATIRDPEAPVLLDPGSLYGLYISWCLMHRIRPVPDTDFRAGMRRCGIDLHQCGLAMTGPAAADYILASHPDPH